MLQPAAHAYLSDRVDPTGKMYSALKFKSSLTFHLKARIFLGIYSVGPTRMIILSILSHALLCLSWRLGHLPTEDLFTLFYVATASHIFHFTVKFFFIPESLSKQKSKELVRVYGTASGVCSCEEINPRWDYSETGI